MSSRSPLPPPDAAELRGAGRTRRLEVPILTGVTGLVHAFTVRGSDPGATLGEMAGTLLPLRTLRQVHGADIQSVGAGSPCAGPAPSPFLEEAKPPVGDGLITAEVGVALAVRVADCLPILICDEARHVLAAVHAGWRGTVAEVLRSAIAALTHSFGSRPDDLRIAMGPSIGPCCFEVGDEVIEAFLSADPGVQPCILGSGRRRIDLVAVARRQALLSGARPDRIQAAGLCTSCRAHLLESHRRGRGQAGRMAGLIAWRPGGL